jgi:hypothetical protein
MDELKRLIKWLQDAATNSGQPTLVLAVTSLVAAAVIREIFG